MKEVKNVLLVTNAITEEEVLLIKEGISKQDIQINLTLMHVIPSLPTCYFNIPSTILLAERYYEEAEQCLTSIGSSLEVEKKNQWLVTGRVKSEVIRLANKLGVHFILASSSNVPELYKSDLFRNESKSTFIRSINNMVQL